MNRLKLLIRNDKIQPYVDNKKLLLKREHIGLSPISFSKTDLTTEGTRQIGICSCGCEGCDDYTVDVSLDGNIVNWYDWHREETFHFDRGQYLKEITTLKIKVIRHNEHYVEKVAEELLSGTVAMDKYHFLKARTYSERKILKLTYSYGADKLEYELPFKEFVGPDLTYYISQTVKEFVISTVRKKGFVLTDAFYGSLNNLKRIFTEEDSNLETAVYERFRRALLCYDPKAIIVTLYYCMDYLPRLRDHLQFIGVSKDVLKSLKVFDNYCFKGKRKLSGKKFEKDLDTITDSIAVEVISAIKCRLADPQKNHPLIRVFEKVRKICSYNQLNKAMAIALNCNTEEERIVSLLHIAAEAGKIKIDDLIREGGNEDITQALALLIECNPLDVEVCYMSIKDNKLAKAVLVQKLKNILYLRDKRQRKNYGAYRILIERLQNDKSNQ